MLPRPPRFTRTAPLLPYTTLFRSKARESDLGSDVRVAPKCGTKPTLVSLVTVAGGLDLGLEDAGFRTILANEIDSAACESLRQNRILRSVTPAAFDRRSEERSLGKEWASTCRYRW